jgi:hypothetical protein
MAWGMGMPMLWWRFAWGGSAERWGLIPLRKNWLATLRNREERSDAVIHERLTVNPKRAHWRQLGVVVCSNETQDLKSS